MKKGKTKLLITMLAMMAAISLALSACGGGSSKNSEVLKMADPGWDSVKLHNQIAGYILEHGYDIKSETISGSTPITWQGIIEDDIQIYMEAWSDQLPTYESDIAEGKLLELSVNFDDNAQGIYVPAYMVNGDAERGIEPLTPDLKTVQDLKNYAEIFPDPDVDGMGRLYGAIASWETDKILYNKYEAYGLDELFTYFRPGSDAAMVAALVSAYESGEPWVGYYWEPTWVSGKYDLILLEDEPYEKGDKFDNGMTAFPSNTVTVVVNPRMAEDYPEVVEFLKNYKTSSALTAEGLAYMNDNDASETEAAIWFLKEHDDMLSQWVTDTKRLENIREALSKEN